MPRLIQKIEGDIDTNAIGTIRYAGIISALDLEDYVSIPSMKAMLQNYLKAISVTELFIDGLDAYRSPDDGNHPVLSYYGLHTATDYVELTISYT